MTFTLSSTHYNTALVLKIIHMDRLLLITDPLGGIYSVQSEFVRSISKYLTPYFDLTVMSVFIDQTNMECFDRVGINAISVRKRSLNLNRSLEILNYNNESMLWLESWLREGLLNKNSAELNREIVKNDFDFVINATNTSPVESDMWWIQGPPLYVTLNDISNDNYLSKLTLFFARKVIEAVDEKLVNKMVLHSKFLIANGKYSYDHYRLRGLNVKGIVYSTKTFDDFYPSTSNPSRDFVLTYIGKETELAILIKMAKHGIKIVAFGSKLPMGSKLGTLSQLIDFRGFIEKEELISLYSNALYTAFPFTNEPFGCIPIESMACGTPVLTYNKQGPAETVINGKTGWLVESGKEFIEKALDLWKLGRTGITQKQCVERATFFTAKNSARLLAQYLDRASEGK